MDIHGASRKAWAAFGAAMVIASGAVEAGAEKPTGGNGRFPPIDGRIPAKVETATFALG